LIDYFKRAKSENRASPSEVDKNIKIFNFVEAFISDHNSFGLKPISPERKRSPYKPSRNKKLASVDSWKEFKSLQSQGKSREELMELGFRLSNFVQTQTNFSHKLITRPDPMIAREVGKINTT
jgi:hypothetical protein